MSGRWGARLAAPGAALLTLILASALGLRLLGVGRGLPYLHEWDEPTILSNVIGMLQRGDLNPTNFIYPSVYPYMLLPVMYLHYWYLHAHGVLWSSSQIVTYHPYAAALPYWWYLSPASFYLWGRGLTVLLGTATVYLAYRIGKDVYGPPAGLLAAALLALAPGAVYYSDTIRVDIPMTFFIALTVLAGLGIVRRGRWQDYLLAGLLAGLAISTKTNAVIVVLALMVAHLVGPHRARPAGLHPAAMGFCVLLGAVIGTPYVLITPETVIATQQQNASFYGVVPSLAAIREALPRHLAYFVRPEQGADWTAIPHVGFGLLPAVFALVGMVVGFRSDRRGHLYLLSFAVPYFLFMSAQRLIAIRNMMPVILFAALFAGAGAPWVWHRVKVGWLTPRTPRLGGLAAGLALAVLLAPPAWDAAGLGLRMRQPDTRTAAVEWLRRYVPAGARIAFQEDLRWYLPDLYRLPFGLHFAPRRAAPEWYLARRIDLAVVDNHSPLRGLPAIAVFREPAYQRDRGSGLENSLVINPGLYIVRPRPSEIDAAFPLEIGARDMLLEPPVARAPGVYAETVHIPYQPFPAGTYVLNVVTEDWSRFWPPGDALMKLTAQVRVGRRMIGEVTVTHIPLRYTAPLFRIDRAEALPVRVDFTFWTQPPPRPRHQSVTGWALRPAAAGCAIASGAQSLDLQRLTVEAWVYLEGMNEPAGGVRAGLESEAPVLSKGKDAGYYLRLVGDSSRRIFADLSVAGKYSVGRGGVVPFRHWTHVAATYDGDEARIYLNGVPAPQASGRSPRHRGGVRAAGAPLVLGCRDPGTPEQTEFKGLITGVRIWNRVLSFDELRSEAGLIPGQSPDTGRGLVGFWSFGTVDRGRVPDLSGTGNDLSAASLERVPLADGPPVRRVLLRTVTIDRAGP